ncbi:hypothetical protein GGI13_008893, partial [Coemansia sp. RSA 455]
MIDTVAATYAIPGIASSRATHDAPAPPTSSSGALPGAASSRTTHDAPAPPTSSSGTLPGAASSRTTHDDPAPPTSSSDVVPGTASSCTTHDDPALPTGFFAAVSGASRPTVSVPVNSLDTTSDSDETVVPPAKRQRTGAIYDSKKELITPPRMHLVLGSSFFMTLPLVFKLYEQVFRCKLASGEYGNQTIYQGLKEMNGFGVRLYSVEGADSGEAASLALFTRSSFQYTAMRQN